MGKASSILSLIFLTANVFGQATQNRSYLAEIRDRSNGLVTFKSDGGVNYRALVGANPLINEPDAVEAIHYVGEYFGGGIVFHVYGKGKHGLITATIDHNQWKNGTDTDSYTISDGIATNKFNARRIVAIKEAGAYDDQIITRYQGNYLSEWYLPTKYELELLYLNRAVLGGYHSFIHGWRSTEVSKVNAWFRSFTTGGKFTNGKDDVVYIRVLRSF
jgi:hypothetical protein